MQIDDARVAGWGARVVGCRWLVGCGLTMAVGCAAQPTASTDPLDALKTRSVSSAGVLEERHPFGAAVAHPRRVGTRVPKALELGVISQVGSDFGVLPELGELEAQVDAATAAVSVNDASEDDAFGAEKLIAPPEARRRPRRHGTLSIWQSVPRAEFTGIPEASLGTLQKVGVSKDAGGDALWRSTSTLPFEPWDHLDDVFDGNSFVAAELARVKATGSQAPVVWLQSQGKRYSTLRFAEGRVAFGFKGSRDSPKPSPGPGLTADLGSLGALPARVNLGIGLGRGTPGLGLLSDTLGAAESSVREQLPTFGLSSEPITSVLPPVAMSGQESAGWMRVSIADQYGGGIKGWLSAPFSRHTSFGSRAIAADLGEQPVGIDAGLQYDLGPEVAVVAAYGYYGRTDVGLDPFGASAGSGRRSDERLHAASLRLTWRLTKSPEAAPAGTATRE